VGIKETRNAEKEGISSKTCVRHHILHQQKKSNTTCPCEISRARLNWVGHIILANKISVCL